MQEHGAGFLHTFTNVCIIPCFGGVFQLLFFLA